MSDSGEGAVVVVANIEAAPGRELEVERALRDAVGKVHQEPGCLRYALNRSTRNAAVFTMVEKWSSQAALDAHAKSEAFTELTGKLQDALARPLDVQVLEPMPEGGEQLGQV